MTHRIRGKGSAGPYWFSGSPRIGFHASWLRIPGSPRPTRRPAAGAASPSLFTRQLRPRGSSDELNQLGRTDCVVPGRAWFAQIVAAASYPTEVVEADRWIQQNSGLKGEEAGQSGGFRNPGDPSVESSHAISFGACDVGQEPFLDLGARAGVCGAAEECPRCSSGDASASAGRPGI